MRNIAGNLAKASLALGVLRLAACAHIHVYDEEDGELAAAPSACTAECHHTQCG